MSSILGVNGACGGGDFQLLEKERAEITVVVEGEPIQTKLVNADSNNIIEGIAQTAFINGVLRFVAKRKFGWEAISVNEAIGMIARRK